MEAGASFGIKRPFSLEHADTLAALLTDAGLADVAVGEFDMPLRARSFEDWWTGRCELAGPLTRILAAQPEEVAQAIRARAREATAPYVTSAGLDFPGVALIASAHRT